MCFDVESERVHSRRGDAPGLFQEPLSGQKERAGSIATPRPKARHFLKNTIARYMHICSALRRFGKLTDLWTLQRHNHPERIQYAQDTIYPWLSRAVASNCLILVAEIVEIPDRGTRAKLSESTLVLHKTSFSRNKKRRGVECIYPI